MFTPIDPLTADMQNYNFIQRYEMEKESNPDLDKEIQLYMSGGRLLKAVSLKPGFSNKITYYLNEILAFFKFQYKYDPANLSTRKISCERNLRQFHVFVEQLVSFKTESAEENSKLITENNDLRMDIHFYQNVVKDRDQTIETLNTKIDTLNKAYQTQSDDLVKLSQELREFKEREAKLEEKEQTLVEKEQTLVEKELKINEVERRSLEHIIEEEEKLETAKEDAKKLLADYENEIKVLESRVKELQRTIGNLENDLAAKKKAIMEAHQELEKAKQPEASAVYGS